MDDKDTEARTMFEREYLAGDKQTGRRNEHGDYVLPSIQGAWAGWCAAYKYLKTVNVDEWG